MPEPAFPGASALSGPFLHGDALGATHQVDEKRREAAEHGADDDEHEDDAGVGRNRHRRVAVAEADRARERGTRHGERHGRDDDGEEHPADHRRLVLRWKAAPYHASPAPVASAAT